MPEPKGKSGIGIELAGDRITVARLKKTPKGITLEEARSIKLPITRKTKNKVPLTDHLIQLFEGLDLRKDMISVGVGGHIGFVRKVKLPPVSQSRLRQVVSFEVQQQVPFRLNEVIWDYQVISPVTRTPSPVEVMITAIKQTFVEELLKDLQGAIKKNPDVVDISSLALHNCLSFNGLLNEEGVGIILHSVFNYTDISIESKGELAFTRAVPIGKRNFLDVICKSRDVKMEEAEQILKNEGEVETILKPIWENLLTEVKRTIHYYLSQVEKVTHFEYIYLSGDIAKSHYFSELLQNSFKADVREINPLQRVAHAPAQVEVVGDNLDVSIGLALRTLVDFPVEVNLLPPRIIDKRKFKEKRLYFLLSFLFVVLIGLTLFAFGIQDYVLTRAKIDRLDPILESYKPYVDKIKELKGKQVEISSKLEKIEKILTQKFYWSNILLEISRFTPSDTYVTSITGGRGEVEQTRETTDAREFSISGEGRSSQRLRERLRERTERQNRRIKKVSPGKVISVSGITSSYPALDEYIENLRASPLFKRIELVSAQRLVQEESQGEKEELSTKGMVQFTLIMEMKD